MRKEESLPPRCSPLPLPYGGLPALPERLMVITDYHIVGRVLPQSEGEEVVWPQDAMGKIVPGMIVGGALYYVEEYDFFHFLTSESQPFLYVDNSGVVQFQEVRSHCSRYMPPLDEVGGRYWALSFMEEVRQVEHRIALKDRLENPMRVHWKLDDPLGEEPHVQFAGFGESLPKEGDYPGDAPH